MSFKKKAIIVAIVLAGFLLAINKYFLYAALIIPALVFVVFFRKIRKAFYLFIYTGKLLLKKHPNALIPLETDASYYLLALHDGRKLGYRLFGPHDGWPVFYFHGTPSSGMDAQMIEIEILEKNEIRLIAIDRPGIGISDFQKQRNFSHWAKDVEEVANKLGIDKFSVLGFSGGAGYVAACAAIIPNRLRTAVIIAGAWKMNVKEANEHVFESIRLFWKVAAKAPFILPYILRAMRTEIEEITEEELELWKHRNTDMDFSFFKLNNRIVILKSSVNHAIANIKGVTWDVLMYVKNWDIALDKIQFPITLLHGLQDRNVPVALVKKTVGILPNATLKLYEQEGHYSILGNQMSDVIFALTGKEAILPIRVETASEPEAIIATATKTNVLPDTEVIPGT